MFHGICQPVSRAIAELLLVALVISGGSLFGQVYSNTGYPATQYQNTYTQPTTQTYAAPATRYSGTSTQPANTSNGRVLSVSAPVSNTFRTQPGTYSQAPTSFPQTTGYTGNPATTTLTPITEALVKLTVTEAIIESAATEVNNAASLTSDEKSIAQSTLQKALQWIQQSRSDSYKASQLAAEIRTAPSRLATLQRLLASPAQTSVRIPDGYAIVDLLSHRERLLLDLNTARDSFTEMTSRYGGEAVVNAGDQWSRQLSDAESELRSLQSSTAATSLTDIKGKCDSLQSQAQKEALQTRIELMRRQTNFNEKHSDLFEAELAAGRRRIQEIEAQIAAIDEAVENSKASSAFQLGDRARAIAANSHPLVSELARYNARLADELAQLSSSRRDVNTRIESTRHKLSTIREDFESVRTKLAQYGLTPTIGALLRHRRDQLDPVHVQLSAIRDVNDRMSNAQRQQLELDLQRTQLDNLDSETDLWIANSHYAGTVDAQQYRQQVYQMLAERRDLVDQLSGDYRLYQKRLDELDTATSDSATTITEFRGLIDKHVTWIRSGSPLTAADVGTAWSGLGAVFDARHTQRLTSDLRTKLSMSPLYGFYLCFSILAVGLIRWKAKATLAQIGKQRQIKQLGLRWTIAAAALTFVLSLIYPACFFLMGQWLADPQATSETLLSVSAGCYAAALVLWLIELPRQLTRPFGIVDKHMDWKLPSRERAFKTLSILAMVLVPLAMGISAVSQLDQGRWRESLGRIGFLLAMLVVAFVAHRALGLSISPSLVRIGCWLSIDDGPPIRNGIWLYIASFVDSVDHHHPRDGTTLAGHKCHQDRCHTALGRLGR
jgi:Mechanosensitive ion channel inner membrane domain 1